MSAQLALEVPGMLDEVQQHALRVRHRHAARLLAAHEITGIEALLEIVVPGRELREASERQALAELEGAT